VDDGRGGFRASGTNAPLYSANFFAHSDPVLERDVHERRLALAFDVDTSEKIISLTSSPKSFSSGSSSNDYTGMEVAESPKSVWANNQWNKKGRVTGEDWDYILVQANPYRSATLEDDSKASSSDSIQISDSVIISLSNKSYSARRPITSR
jgi:hypothetical protein